jgi:hypothetical protein
MSGTIRIGDRVEIHLDSRFGEKQGWYEGVVVKIDRYSNHRNFYWVQLSADARAALGIQRISVFNPKKIRKTEK